MGFNLLGDGLRDVLDPRLRRSRRLRCLSLLSVRGLSVDFVTDGGVAQVLDGITLDVGPARSSASSARAGAAETTLARAILASCPSGATRIRGGEVRFKGADSCARIPARSTTAVRGRAITFIPQDPYTSFSPCSPSRRRSWTDEWKSPRAGRRRREVVVPALSARALGAPTATPCLDTLRAVQIPGPAARSAGCRTSSPAGSASGS